MRFHYTKGRPKIALTYGFNCGPCLSSFLMAVGEDGSFFVLELMSELMQEKEVGKFLAKLPSSVVSKKIDIYITYRLLVAFKFHFRVIISMVSYLTSWMACKTDELH